MKSNTEGPARVKGGIALHYHMKDLCNNQNDERPISPAKDAIKPTPKSEAKPHNVRKIQKQNERDAPKHRYTSSQSRVQNKSLKQLMDRDKKLALKQRKRLDSARSKNSQANLHSNITYTKSFDKRVST